MVERSNSMDGWTAVVLAAGKGARMQSQTPKPLHLLGGVSLIRYALEAVNEAGFETPIIVRSPSSALPDALGPTYRYAVQEEANGTGGALQPGLGAIDSETKNLLVVNGDMPFISSDSLRRLAETHTERRAGMSLLVSSDVGSSGLGRVVVNANGIAERIVEASDPDFGQVADGPVNVGAYCFDVTWLQNAVESLPTHENGEVYLTDLVALARSEGQIVVHVAIEDAWEAAGINTRVDLARAEQEVRRRILEALMLSGVTVQDPSTTYVDASVTVGADTVIRPNTHITGETKIGENCDIGPGSQIADSTIGDGCRVWSSALEEATLEENVSIGPFSHLRPGAYLSRDVHIGNFGEVKASRLGQGVAMGHFGYVGDAQIGDDVNLGAGLVTCNFDGVEKHETIVEEGAFIGSDTMLVAPVRVGARASTGAGSVVTKDVPAEAQVAGVPARLLGEEG